MIDVEFQMRLPDAANRCIRMLFGYVASPSEPAEWRRRGSNPRPVTF